VGGYSVNLANGTSCVNKKQSLSDHRSCWDETSVMLGRIPFKPQEKTTGMAELRIAWIGGVLGTGLRAVMAMLYCVTVTSIASWWLMEPEEAVTVAR
jgi:hypothetical protein